ncbi:MAG: EAL domain-containing protein, partial [Chloroflexi bacterium]|nr:EAL domain-containing protein [Chloroflexota bacterium]
IDRSFVNGVAEDEQDAAIVRSVVALARTLGMRVTAEGIETAEQLEALRGMACDDGQGYLFARPAASEAITSLLQAAATAANATTPLAA